MTRATADAVTLPAGTVSESNRRDHWRVRAKRAKRQRQLARTLCPLVPLPATVRLVRLSPSALDDDNLRGALKAVRDGVADRLGVDDRDPRVTWEYAQERGTPTGAVRLELSPDGDPECP